MRKSSVKANRGTDLYTVNRAMQDGLMSSMRTAIPGIIQSFDPKTQTAVIQPAIRKRVFSGEQGEVIQEQEPLLLDVPVMFLGGGVSALTFPVAEGDECLVIFADSNIDAWYQSGGVQNQVYPRLHNVADGFAIVGFRSKPKAIGDVAGDMPVIDNLRVSGKLYAQIEGRIDRATDADNADNADKLGGCPASDYAFDSDVEALGTSLTNVMNDGFSSLTNWANNTFSALGHDHEWSEIQSKPSVFPPSLHGHPWSAITEKPDTYPATEHGHPWSAISDKPTIYPTNWDNVADKPSTFPPSTHNHTKAQITDFPTSMPASDVYAWAKAATKPSYTAAEVGAAESSHNHTSLTGFTSISGGGATKNWQMSFNNDSYIFMRDGTATSTIRFYPNNGDVWFSGSLTGGTVPWARVSGAPTSYPASDVYAWAKAATKPTYTQSEVGLVGTWDSPTTATDLPIGINYNHIDTNRTGFPTTYGLALSVRSNSDYGFVLYYARTGTGNLYYNPGVPAFSGWRTIIDSSNYNSYAPTKTGTGASGTWPIGARYLHAHEGRITSANIPVAGNAQHRILLSTSSMTTGKPGSDGFIQHYEWDNTGGWSVQTFVSNSPVPMLQARSMRNGVWGSWVQYQKKITSGTAAPTGGVDGDIYLKHLA